MCLIVLCSYVRVLTGGGRLRQVQGAYAMGGALVLEAPGMASVFSALFESNVVNVWTCSLLCPTGALHASVLHRYRAIAGTEVQYMWCPAVQR